MNFENRTIDLFIPDYVEENETLPLIVMQDGQFVLENKEGHLGLADFINDNKLKVALLIVPCDLENRKNEYCPYQSGVYADETFNEQIELSPVGKDYAKYIAEVVIPHVVQDNGFRFTRVYLAGISLGALVSMYMLATYPNKFDGLISVSGAYYINQEAIEEKIRESSISNAHRIYIDYGTEENDDELIAHRFIESNNRIAGIIQSKGSRLKHSVFEGHKHNYTYFKDRMNNAIKEIIK
ncbi:alpha/beta hydrolase [Macrococcus animalis]|uniref:alpha/beta hydrolase n=1 Tax=Macrococcus animalis TaxID=3395467 RepID=UPI0039BEA98E